MSNRTQRRGRTPGLPTNDGSFRAEERAALDPSVGEGLMTSLDEADRRAAAAPILEQVDSIAGDLNSLVNEGFPAELLDPVVADIDEATSRYEADGDEEALAEALDAAAEALPRVLDNADTLLTGNRWWAHNRARIRAMIGGYGPRMHFLSNELRGLKRAAKSDYNDLLSGLGLDSMKGDLPGSGGMGRGHGAGHGGHVPQTHRPGTHPASRTAGRTAPATCPHCGTTGRWDDRLGYFDCRSNCEGSDRDRASALAVKRPEPTPSSPSHAPSYVASSAHADDLDGVTTPTTPGGNA